MSKGSISNTLPMLGIMLATMAFTVQSIPINQAFGNEVQQSISDLDRISQTKSLGHLFLYNQAPLSGSYSVQNASYQMGKEGGGINWNTEKVQSNSVISIGEDVFRNFYGEANEAFVEEYLNTGTALRDCDMNTEDFRILVNNFDKSVDRVGIEGLIDPQGRLNIDCKYTDGGVNYKSENIFVEFDAEDNRFYQLAADTTLFFKDLSSSWGENVEDEYSASEKACSKKWAEAERDAVRSAENDINSSLEDVETDYPSYEEFSIEKLTYAIDTQTFPRDTETDTFRGSQEESKNSWRSSDCGGCDTCRRHDEEGNLIRYDCNCDKKHKVTVTITPESTDVNWTLEDNKYKVPTKDDGWQNLEFKAHPYSHDFTSD